MKLLSRLWLCWLCKSLIKRVKILRLKVTKGEGGRRRGFFCQTSRVCPVKSCVPESKWAVDSAAHLDCIQSAHVLTAVPASAWALLLRVFAQFSPEMDKAQGKTRLNTLHHLLKKLILIEKPPLWGEVALSCTTRRVSLPYTTSYIHIHMYIYMLPNGHLAMAETLEIEWCAAAKKKKHTVGEWGGAITSVFLPERVKLGNQTYAYWSILSCVRICTFF